jgi:8-oxo-dGTP pyrophosphatase MutT (NUDIX family)
VTLELDPNRKIVPPKDAATLILVRDPLEIFCVQRSKASAFLGGAIVFPGGKVDPSDADPGWAPHSTEPRPASFAADPSHLRALAIAACRESLEEAALLPVCDRQLEDAELAVMRKEPFREAVTSRGLVLDLAALQPFARWVTPEAEARRYDTRFYLMKAPEGQSGAHDQHETVSSFWASPAEILRRWEAGVVQLMPPTHATIALLASCSDTEDAFRLASANCLDPIQPRLVVKDGTMALVLPGDPEHEVKEKRLIGGASRYVIGGDRIVPG